MYCNLGKCTSFLSIILMTMILIARTIHFVKAGPPPLAFPPRPVEDSVELTETTVAPSCPKGQRFHGGRCRRIYTSSSSSSRARELNQIQWNYVSIEEEDSSMEKLPVTPKSKRQFKKPLQYLQ